MIITVYNIYSPFNSLLFQVKYFNWFLLKVQHIVNQRSQVQTCTSSKYSQARGLNCVFLKKMKILQSSSTLNATTFLIFLNKQSHLCFDCNILWSSWRTLVFLSNMKQWQGIWCYFPKTLFFCFRKHEGLQKYENILTNMKHRSILHYQNSCSEELVDMPSFNVSSCVNLLIGNIWANQLGQLQKWNQIV